MQLPLLAANSVKVSHPLTSSYHQLLTALGITLSSSSYRIAGFALTRKMCTTKIYKNEDCGCQWAAIDMPCGFGMGFSVCPSFGNGQTVQRMRYFKAKPGSCPWHDYNYSSPNEIRRVLKMRKGVKWGEGPARVDRGIEFTCSVM